MRNMLLLKDTVYFKLKHKILIIKERKIMQLTITDLIPDTITPNSYEVVIETMAGDGDAYENIVAGPFIKDEQEHIMQHLIATLSEVAVAVPIVVNGVPSYNHVSNFDIWFGVDYYSDKEQYDENNTSEVTYEEYTQLEEFLQGFNDETEWPADPTTDHLFPNSYVGFNVYYYDENKNKFAVLVEE